VFLKEKSRDLYSLFTFWAVTSIPLYVVRAMNGVIFGCIVYKLLQLGDSTGLTSLLAYYLSIDPFVSVVEKYGFFMLSSMTAVLASVMVTEAIIFAIVNDIRIAYLAIPAMSFIFFCFCGFFVKPSTLPHWIACWAPSFSIIRWSMQALFINMFSDDRDTFPVVNNTNTYKTFLSLFGWGGKTKWYCLEMMLVNIVVYKVIAFIVAGCEVVSQRGGRQFYKNQVMTWYTEYWR
jgi:hypothetical protein